MSIRFPSEIVVERFLPTVRAMLATELADRGLTQQEIAGWLGVSQAAVSNYLGGDATVDLTELTRLTDRAYPGSPANLLQRTVLGPAESAADLETAMLAAAQSGGDDAEPGSDDPDET